MINNRNFQNIPIRIEYNLGCCLREKIFSENTEKHFAVAEGPLPEVGKAAADTGSTETIDSGEELM